MRKLPLHLVPDEIEWTDEDGTPICVTPLNALVRLTLAQQMVVTKQSFETTANRALRYGLKALKRKAAA